MYYLNRFIISLSIKFPNVNTVCVVTPSPFYRRPILHNDSCFDSPWGGYGKMFDGGQKIQQGLHCYTHVTFKPCEILQCPASPPLALIIILGLLSLSLSFIPLLYICILLFLCFLYLPISISLWISASLFSLYLCLSSYLYIALNLCFTGSLFSLYLQSFLLYLSQSYLCFYPCLFFFIYIYLSLSISLFLYLFCCIYLRVCPIFVSILVSFSFSLSISISLYLSIFLYPSLHISSFFSLSSSLPLFSLSLECCPPFSKIFAF